jgi:hypothetical protein
MKLSDTHSKRTGLSKHDKYALLVGFILICLLSYPTYYFANQYFNEQSQSYYLETQKSLVRLRQQQVAFKTIRDIEATVAALKADKLDATTAEELYAQAKVSFTSGNYIEINAFLEKIGSLSAQLREEDQERLASATARVATLEKKRDDYKKQGVDVATVSTGIASTSAYIAEKEYDKADDLFTLLSKALDSLLAKKKEAEKLAAAKAAAAAVLSPVAAQSSGGVTYERKNIQTSIGTYTADVLTVDMNRVKVKTFTANENDCAADCPLKSLASYVAENGGIAGINGTYFCPADYASCATVKNSFNTLVFDYRSKKYLNSDQNKFSVNPLISFYPDGAHYYTQALGFGRDTSANGVISNHPTLVHGGGVATNVNLDAKSAGAKTTRGGIGFRGKTLWAVMTRGATVPESGYVFVALGAEYAMNLDGGGSSALYFGGYKVGPGRNLPNAVVFTP